MKIAYDHQIFSCQKYGGISRYIFELGNNLAQHTSSEINIISPIHVNEYLKNHPEVTHWVAVDDMDLSKLENFVMTKRPHNEGIKQSGIKEKIIKFLQ